MTDIEVERPLAALAPPGAYEGTYAGAYDAVRAVVRARGVPIAGLSLPLGGGRVDADVAEAVATGCTTELTRYLLRRWLARPSGADAPTWEHLATSGDVAVLAPIPDPPDPALPAATVAVCTRDRPEDLARCLAAIAALDYPAYEVLVVDNAPRTDATERLIREQFPAVRYAREPRPGLDWARNRAIAAARGEVLAFTDDDVTPDPGWLRALGRVFAGSSAVMAVSGMIEPAELDTPAQRDFEAYSGFGHGWERRWLRGPRRAGWPEVRHHGGGWLGTGANMAFRRTLFDTLGGFDPALDVGTVTQGGGDLDMFFRTVQEGHLLVYAPEALVRHRHRRGDDELRRQLTTWGSGYHAYVRRSRRAYPEERRAFDRLARWWWGEYVIRDLLRAVRRRDRVALLRRYEVLGTIRGLRSYDRAARGAARLLAQYPDEPTTLPRPSAPRAPVSRAGRSVTRAVAVDAPLVVPIDVGDVDTVDLTVTARGRVIAHATAVAEGACVSAAQLRDVVAGALATRLLADGAARAAAQRSLARWIGGTHDPAPAA